MSEETMEQWEARLQGVAHDFPYPPTPDLAVAVRARLTEKTARPTLRRQRLAWAAVVVLVFLVGLMAVPQVRAAVLRVLRLGAVEIIVEPTPTSTLAPSVTPEIQPTASSLASILDLAGETTLVEARVRVPFAVRLPSYPPDLGPPDRVYHQRLGGQVVILAWLEPERPDRVRLSLHLLGPGAAVQKVEPQVIQETTVHGQPALWTEGPYFLRLSQGYGVRRLIEGHVLIWAEGEVTYRLETDLSLNEAVRIAESLR